MQFSLHYSFESECRARTALRNISSNLKQGGIFIGTIPDANWIVKRLKSLPEDELKFGNDIYSIKFEQKEHFPMYGHKYWFWLEDAVDCPEYLVHFGAFEKLAAEYGLELRFKRRFHDVYHEAKEERMYRDLLYFMKVIRENSADGEMSEAEWEAAGLYTAFAFEKVRYDKDC
jgi:mRNA (guanine-N7-)-methyltransferase